MVRGWNRWAGVGALLALVGCKPAPDFRRDAGTSTQDGSALDAQLSARGNYAAAAADALSYRELSTHPGCAIDGLSYPAADVPGYLCAAKAYPVTSEDPQKPIVILIHGNSDSPAVWEAYTDDGCDPIGATQGEPMLSERLSAAGFRVYALDMRFDRVDDLAGNNDTENAAKNMNHGWGVPIAQHFIASVLAAFPDREISVVGHSFGVTVARDALRRLAVNDGLEVFPRVRHMMMLAGANHGVSSFNLCGANPTMRGEVACEMGNRAAYSPTAFSRVLNGPGGAWETPCSDSASAFGNAAACQGHTIQWITVVMADKPDGEQQDLFVSEASSALQGAENITIGLNDFDTTDYFFCGLFRNHYAPARNLAALDLIVSRLER